MILLRSIVGFLFGRHCCSDALGWPRRRDGQDWQTCTVCGTEQVCEVFTGRAEAAARGAGLRPSTPRSTGRRSEQPLERRALAAILAMHFDEIRVPKNLIARADEIDIRSKNHGKAIVFWAEKIKEMR